MQSKCKSLRGARVERDVWPVSDNLFGFPGAVRSKLLIDKSPQIGALPATLRQQGVRARKRPYSTIDRGDVGFDGVGAGEPHDRLHQSKCVTGAMIDLAGQKRLPLCRFLAFG